MEYDVPEKIDEFPKPTRGVNWPKFVLNVFSPEMVSLFFFFFL